MSSTPRSTAVPDPEAPVSDYVIVGGGTAGSVIASRLTEDPGTTVTVIEGGPTDIDRDDVLTLRRWLGLLGGDLDYDYPTTEQPRGNSHIRHSRARVLGGCSSHNTLISFKPLPGDWDEWAEAGAEGWDAAAIDPYFAKLRNNIVPVDEKDRNAIARDFVDAARQAAGVPRVESFNREPFHEGVGFFDLAYHPENNKRSSASVAYLHPHIEAGDRPNLRILLETWAYRLEFDGTRATGVHVRTEGRRGDPAARRPRGHRLRGRGGHAPAAAALRDRPARGPGGAGRLVGVLDRACLLDLVAGTAEPAVTAPAPDAPDGPREVTA
ncbi:Oxygen-dependent choline dehydrogenase [Streptomyces californicus]